MSYVSLVGVSKFIRRRAVLDNVSLEVPKGIVAGFTGVNGSGKTMLFRAVSGLVGIDRGSISIDGAPLDRRRRYPVNLGIMLDSSGYWDNLSGLENLEMLAGIRGLVGRGEAARALEAMGLDPADDRPTSSYSMGMRQRLAIAQAIMERPDLLILDEPTNALDVDGIELVRDVICGMRGGGATVLVSTHDQPRLEELFDLHVHVCDGRATREASGT